ncbi:MAG: exopolysaccharide biosynthesis protein [bacterium]
MNSTAAGPKPLSIILSEALADEEVTIGELADRVQRRGFGLAMIILALPTMIPVLPPGSSALVGLLYILLALQMLWGLEQPWLPHRLRAYRLSLQAVRGLRHRGVPFLERIERYSRPRPLPLDERLVTRAVALVMLILGVILFLPIPFLNTLPAISVLVLGVGLLNRDSVFMLTGAAIATSVIIIIGFGAGTLYTLYAWLLHWAGR